ARVAYPVPHARRGPCCLHLPEHLLLVPQHHGRAPRERDVDLVGVVVDVELLLLAGAHAVHVEEHPVRGEQVHLRQLLGRKLHLLEDLGPGHRRASSRPPTRPRWAKQPRPGGSPDLAAVEGAMGLPGVSWNAFCSSGTFAKVPLTRYSGGGWGSVVAR